MIEANSLISSSYSKCVATFFSADTVLTSLNWALLGASFPFNLGEIDNDKSFNC